jgi:hypothetical protein
MEIQSIGIDLGKTTCEPSHEETPERIFER